MILRDRVPFRVSWWGMIPVLVLGFLVLPGWSQSKEETTRLPEAESTAADAVGEDAPATIDVSGSDADLLAEPKDGRIDDSKPKGKKKNRRFIDIELNGALIGAEPTDVDLDGDLDIVIFQKEATTENAARMRDARLQELESKLQSLLEELQELRGKKNATTTVPSTPSKKVVKNLSTLTEVLRNFTGVAKQQEALIAEKRFAEAQAALIAAQRQKQAEAAKQRDLAKKHLAKTQATLADPRHQTEDASARQRILVNDGGSVLLGGRPDEAETKQAEVVETKTITLVRTTYRLSRVDAKLLEALIKEIVTSDVLQIKITDRRISLNLLSTNSDLEPAENRRFIPGVGTVSEKQILGSTITVTTTPEHQQYIGQLIALIEKAPRLESSTRKKTPTILRRRSNTERPVGSPELAPDQYKDLRLRRR